MESEFFDLVVIGPGPAGDKGAKYCLLFGKRVAIVEKAHVVGGRCRKHRTLPSKDAARDGAALSGLKARKLYGVDLSLRREATILDFMHHERSVKAANARGS